MKMISKELLEEKVKISKSFGQLLTNLSYSKSNNVKKRLEKLVNLYNIDVSHFDLYHAAKDNSFPFGDKTCLYCNFTFMTKIGNCKELKYCSRKCANSQKIGNRHSKDAREKVSKTLTKLRTERKCLMCNNIFIVLESSKKKFCSISCGCKFNWTNDSYKEKHSHRISEMIKNGKFGWRTREELSFPERVYKKILEDNGFKDKFINNFQVLNGKGCYYLDFYFPKINLNLEIDGQQHKKAELKLRDSQRDEFLAKNNFNILRLEWREITTENGKKFLEKQKQILLSCLKRYHI